MQIRKLHHLSKTYRVNKQIIENYVDWFGEEETIEIIKLEKSNLKKTARVNLLKTTRKEVRNKLKVEGIEFNNLELLQEGINIKKGKSKIGYSQTYLHGEVMPQGYGSMLAVDALDPKPNEVILDMAAAPGGKSCFIAERMKNTGLLVANDKSMNRLSSLIGNLSRHEIMNVLVTQYDALNFPNMEFDKILLDAPCSGDGLIVSNKDRRLKGMDSSYQLKSVQVSLVRKCIEMLKPNGIGVYSTCSLSPIENEEVLQHFIDQIKIEEIKIDGEPGNSTIDSQFSNARRLLPSKYYCDGFFIAKFRRIG